MARKRFTTEWIIVPVVTLGRLAARNIRSAVDRASTKGRSGFRSPTPAVRQE